MGSYIFDYSVRTDTHHLAYMPEDNFPGTQTEGVYSNGELVPEGPWTAFVSPYAIQANGGIGLQLQLQSGELLELIAHPNPPAAVEGVMFVEFPGRSMTLRVEHDEGIIRYSHSENLNDWTEVASFSPASPVSEVGVVLRYDREEYSAGGQAGQARLLPGIWENVFEEVWLGEPDQLPARRGAPLEATVTSTSEPLVHVIVGAQFGDLEFDVGKSVRWVTWFCDNVFVLDVNLGTPRYWIVNWTETFPDAEHTVTGINYFVRPTEFRAEQWKQYKLSFGEPDDDDWILWLDASEGLNVDNRSLPDDYAFAPFKSFLWREIQRAEDLGQPYAVLPYYVFLRSDNIINVTYPTGVDTGGLDIGPKQAIATPYYQAHQGLPRLWKASELKKPDFDWSRLDTAVAPSAGAKTALVSYAYAHWNLQDIEPPAVTVPELTAENDDGYRMRQLMSRVRPIPGIPVSDTWISPSSDPAGLPGPWSPADANNPDPISNSGPYLNPTVGTATIPRPGLLPDDVTFIVKVTGPTGGTAAQTIAAMFEGPGREWILYRESSDGTFVFVTYPSGASSPVVVNYFTWLQTPILDSPETYALTIQRDKGDGLPLCRMYRPDGGGWVALDGGRSDAPWTWTATTTDLRIGGWAGANAGWNGRIFSVECRTGFDPAGGEVLWRFDAANPIGWTLTDEDAIVANTADPLEQPVTPDPSLLGLVTPLYDNAFRLNMRDGVWYEAGVSGNIPLKWDEASQTWTTDYDPAEWADHGVKAFDPTAVPDPVP